ncbi:MAG: 3,4-dihydroxy-2-butanone-4-phosphate synthase [Roseitalea sp.]|jgi:3,4-dihydroxy 2-butanone 4-phosphate synthase/GTP cyclohydrolase II|nr:3,4-dihydroxy-2-butanone-4-phosphate synthase [Roseitalea sp.]MBO6722066.1 3,4-dihydroxy-2-butanone-4-phosphate synthase [Roseitalea sp.]MBO6741686.1 3,4-dihydroxy-2-butanone-4-phosphate synthase [Roseitalea sp.]
MIITSLYSILEEATALADDGRVQAVEAALSDLRAGRPVIVVDDDDRENEGDLIMPAEMASAEWLAFIVRHTTGIVCVAMEDKRADALHLPLMWQDTRDPFGTAFTVSVDAATGVSTGVAAKDRARTIRLLADPDAHAADFTRPGHVFPLRARAGGVRARRGHTEAAVELSRLAGLAPVGLLCELTRDDGHMMRRPDLEIFAAAHDLRIVSIEALVRHLDHRDIAQMAGAGSLITGSAAAKIDHLTG